jgi:protein-L-isoaspartate O-methyltransferase
MRTVPHESFLPEQLWKAAYEDAPLPIAAGQPISQPYIVALMAEALELELQGAEISNSARRALRNVVSTG